MRGLARPKFGLGIAVLFLQLAIKDMALKQDFDAAIGQKATALRFDAADGHNSGHFDAEQGSTRYGDEIDLSYGHPIPAVPGLTALVKYASYDADTAVLRGNVANVDTDKLWLQMQYIY